MDLNHLYLLVRNLDRSIDFYRRFFGFLLESVAEARRLQSQVRSAGIRLIEAYRGAKLLPP